MRVVEIGRQAHVDADGHGAVALQVAGLGDVAEVGDLVGARASAERRPARAGAGIFRGRDAHLVALEDVALQGEGHGGGDEIVGIVAGEDEHLGVRVDGIGPHGDRGAGSCR